MDELAMAIAPEEAMKGDDLMAVINDMIDQFLEEKIAEDAEAVEGAEAIEMMPMTNPSPSPDPSPIPNR